MKVNDFNNDLQLFINRSGYAQKAVKRYETGYITFSECLACIMDEYNNADFVYTIQYKKAGKGGKYKPFSDTEYDHREIWEELSRLKLSTTEYRFKAYKKLKTA